MAKSTQQKRNVVKALWFPLSLVCLAYGLLGWHLAAYPISWLFVSHLAAILATSAFIWGGRVLDYFLRLGPRSVVTMLILSSAITLAVAASTLFTVILILFATKLFARLEIRAGASLNRIFCLGSMTVVAWIGLSLGWLTGAYLVPSSPYWLESGQQNLSWWS